MLEIRGQFPGDRSQWEEGNENLLRNLGKAMSVYCNGISSSSIVQLLLKFAHKEVHILLFHTSVAEFPIIFLIKIFTNLSKKKMKEKTKKLNSVLKIKFPNIVFSFSEVEKCCDHQL